MSFVVYLSICHCLIVTWCGKCCLSLTVFTGLWIGSLTVYVLEFIKSVLCLGKLLCSSRLQGQHAHLYSQPIKTCLHIKNCLPQRDCQCNIKIDALQRLLDCFREAKFQIFSKPQKAQLKGLGHFNKISDNSK